MKRLASLLVVAAIAIAAAGCSTASAANPTGSSAGGVASTGGGSGVTVHIDAKNIAFTESSVTAPADRPFQIAFSSQDGAPHNVTIVGPDGSPVFTGDAVSGPGSTTYAVPALKAGTYQFRCDIHPNMTGTLVVQ